MAIVSLLSFENKLHSKDDYIKELRTLGEMLARKKVTVLTHFSPALFYVKETILDHGGRLVPLSPACSKEEHHEVYRLSLVHGEDVIYTGLGKTLTMLTLVRSAECIIALDDEAYDEALLLKDETKASIYKLGTHEYDEYLGRI